MTSESIARHYFVQTRGAEGEAVQLRRAEALNKWRTKMRNTVTILGALLIAGSAMQTAAAAERHPRKVHRAPVAATQQFRDANDSMAFPNQQIFSDYNQDRLSDYSEGHVISAPAGH
jgi:hypothetical protein